MGILSALCGCFNTTLRFGRPGRGGGGDEDDGGESSGFFFELQTLQIATNFFSEMNKLGHGGFGPVYRGFMPNGQEVAVKKLSMNSRQGLREFTNEVRLLLKIQHKNLVTLLGCCADGPEKMLIYEYLPNKSLDYVLFDKRKSLSLDWFKRFRMVTGIARGLLYLHEEAPERIIHRDIKASNILLDEELNPKISDFGLARLFPGDETHAQASRISGTHGYMAPEYAMHGYLSVKADVFSFGILVLEIVSGRKNHDRALGGEKTELLSYTWTLFQEGKALELVDPSLAQCNPEEATMCIQIGLLCCQAIVAARPNMRSIHLMLSSDSFTLPRPGKPGIQGRRGRWTTTTNTNTTSALTNNTNNATSSDTGTTNTKVSVGSSSSFVEDYSRNSISYSSINEGR
ncbi:Cysteine-rich receptor-like protein kinase 10 [Camellia lanceoleosa]|uniref:Cysteine-rich receptor-like protein kinase 10 n=1 Tax=Camellia lanceoleosa TaxID=1840588 RepID=A0ACC0I589_9ERIC|nr:Cysteine-rich receptor-like protein kinase 10 [Camellia lanceoleosa]